MNNTAYRRQIHAAYQGELIGESLYRERDAESIQFLVDHEVTLVEFVRLEMTAMGSGSSLRVLEAFLKSSRRR
jgi:hypothetical protein